MGQKASEQLFKSHLYTLKKIRLLIFAFFGALTIGLILSSCANRGVITGGEKDTIPPELVSSVPFNESLDFRGTEIVLTFDERVQAAQLKRQLLITPFTDVEYKVKVNKYFIQLTFEEPFSDSTTYTLNFSNAITDVTENNPAENATIAFSTWHIIDSLSMVGKITDHLTNQPIEGAAVSVYQALDTTDIFSGKPYYFAFTNESGQFSINNMKEGEYRVYAFVDENRNYTNEPATEPHGFISDTIFLDNDADSLYIGLILQDVQELKLINSRTLGNRFDVRYNKYVQSYSISPVDSTDLIGPSTVAAENLVVRFYNSTQNYTDSIGYYLTVNDSVGNTRVDTIYAKFSEREVTPEILTPVISPPNKSAIDDQLALTFSFTKPVVTFQPDSLLIKYDTLKSVVFDSVANWDWNWNNTELTAHLSLDKEFLPNTLARLRLGIDSLITLDTLAGIPLDSAKKLRGLKRRINPYSVQVYGGRGTFISVENDSTQEISIDYIFKQPEKFGKITGIIDIDSTFFIIQLIDNKFKTIKEIENQKNYQFDFVPAGSYNIRVLVDANGDGKWSFGNVVKGLEPEPVYFHESFVELRENWEINNINLTVPR